MLAQQGQDRVPQVHIGADAVEQDQPRRIVAPVAFPVKLHVIKRSERHLFCASGRDRQGQRRTGLFDDFRLCHAWSQFDQRQPAIDAVHRDHGQIGDDQIDTALAGQRQRAIGQDLGLPSLAV